MSSCLRCPHAGAGLPVSAENRTKTINAYERSFSVFTGCDFNPRWYQCFPVGVQPLSALGQARISIQTKDLLYCGQPD